MDRQMDGATHDGHNAMTTALASGAKNVLENTR